MDTYHQEHIRTPELETELEELRAGTNTLLASIESAGLIGQKNGNSTDFHMVGLFDQQDIQTRLNIEPRKDKTPDLRVTNTGVSVYDDTYNYIRFSFVGGDLQATYIPIEPGYKNEPIVRVNEPRDITYLKELIKEAPRLIAEYQTQTTEQESNTETEMKSDGRMRKFAKIIFKNS